MKAKKIIVLIATSILIINMIISYSFYSAFTNEKIQDNADDRLEEIASFGYYLFDNKLEQQIQNLQTTAITFGVVDNLTEENQYELLHLAQEQNDLYRSAFTKVDGAFITSDNVRGNAKGEDFFESSMQGNVHISEPAESIIDSAKKVFTLSAPVKKDDVVTGVLSYSYSCDELEEIFNLSTLDGNGHTVIVNVNGDILMGALEENEPHTNVLEHLKFLQKKDTQITFDKDRGQFDIQSHEGKADLLASYQRLSTKDWYVVTLVEKDTISATSDDIQNSRQMWVGYIGLSFIIYASIILVLVRQHMRNRDKLTGLLTFNAFKKKASQRLLGNKNQRYIIIKLDIRNFKLINRVYGFDVGNEVIKNMGRALEETLGQIHGYLIAHLIVDNFILMLPFEDKGKIESLRNNFIHNFRYLMGESFVDIVDFPTGQYITQEEDTAKDNIDDIYEKVNFAHQIAKQSTLDLIVDYEESLEQKAIYHKDLEDRMHTALYNDEFKLYLQPKFCVDTEEVCGAEALIRWVEKDGTILSPATFIPLFEKNGFITQLDLFMFESVAKLLKQMIDEGKEVYTISVNFSRLHLYDKGLCTELCRIADKYNVPHHLFEIELTESIVFDNIDVIIMLIDELHDNGFTISIDDFGAGYSSLALLKDVKMDVVKLDQSFFSITRRDKRSDIVITNILKMTRELSIKTVAEGIETEDYVMFLKDSHCDMIQGYYYSKPIPKEEYIKRFFK